VSYGSAVSPVSQRTAERLMVDVSTAEVKLDSEFFSRPFFGSRRVRKTLTFCPDLRWSSDQFSKCFYDVVRRVPSQFLRPLRLRQPRNRKTHQAHSQSAVLTAEVPTYAAIPQADVLRTMIQSFAKLLFRTRSLQRAVVAVDPNRRHPRCRK